jgi:hypothetical protein
MLPWRKAIEQTSKGSEYRRTSHENIHAIDDGVDCRVYYEDDVTGNTIAQSSYL